VASESLQAQLAFAALVRVWLRWRVLELLVAVEAQPAQLLPAAAQA